MNVVYSGSFQRSYRGLGDERRQDAVTEAIQTFLQHYGRSTSFPPGLRHKPFHASKKYREFASSLADRILYLPIRDGVEFKVVGSHDELRRFAREN